MRSFLSSKWLQYLFALALLRDDFQLKDVVSASTPHNPLDIGAVNNCTVPTDLKFCDISYPVPEAVASLSRVWETLIQNLHDQSQNSGESQACLNEIKERFCAQYFPRCSPEEKVVTAEVAGECLPSCQIKPICKIPFEFRPNSSLGECKLVSEYAGEYNYDFKQCGDDVDQRYVTEWMFHFLRHEDKVLESSIGEFWEMSPSDCQPDFFKFKCEEIGRCWNNGDRIELSQNKEKCDQLLTTACFSGIQYNVVSLQLACDSYPDVESLTTMATPIIPSGLDPENTVSDQSSSSPAVQPSSSSTVQPSSSPTLRSCLLTHSFSLVCLIIIIILLNTLPSILVHFIIYRCRQKTADVKTSCQKTADVETILS